MKDEAERGREEVGDPRWRLLYEQPGFPDRLARHRTSLAIALELTGMRRRAGLGMRELARAAGWDAAFVARLEAGRGTIPTLGTLLRYARACGAEVDLVFRQVEEEARVGLGDDVLDQAAEGGAVRPAARASRARATGVVPERGGRRAAAKA
jgi:transcriptional regulator with XRE-family HTH domain